MGAQSHQAPVLPRSLLSLLPPLLSLALQWLLWGLIQPYVWFLFYPAVFLSSWIGGLRAGLAATVMSTGLVWWFFVPPSYSLVKDPRQLFPAGVFFGMGVLFALFHGRLRSANRQALDALEAAQRAREEAWRLYLKTRELDELKTRFFASVSHELRTPLTLILGPAERMLAAADATSAAARELGVITRNARTLLGHVNDLLDVSKLEAGAMKVDYVELDLASLARFVAGHFESFSVERGTSLRLDVPASLAAQLDGAKVQRVLINLLSNAFKFTPTGGQVRLTLRERDGRAIIEVADSGPGIPVDKREVVFERFLQLEGGPTRRFGGTGLGLSIAREFVLLQQGSIAISTAPEGGALFVVELPVKAPAQSVVCAQSGPASLLPVIESPQARPAGGVTGTGDALVLVVEDNPEMSRFVIDSLSGHHRVATAFDGKEGLARARELKPDVILSDLMMPGLSGEELVHAVRRCPELDATPIVLVSARADDALRVKLLEEGAQDYLTKPFSVGELRVRVDNLVARKRAEEHNARLRRQVEDVAQASMAVSQAVARLPEASLSAVLKTIALNAQNLTSAEFAAVGISHDAEHPFEPWAAVGMSEAVAAQIGRTPRPVGLLGVLPTQTAGLRLRDLTRHPAYRGLPPHHPAMTSFLGVPIRYRGHAVGNLYLANKRGAPEFTEQDQRLVEMLAVRAGVAIETAQLYAAEGNGRAWLQSVIEQMPEGVVLMDAEGRVTAENRAVQAMGTVGLEPDRFGNPVRLDLRRPSGQRLTPDELPNVRALQRQEITEGLELVARRADGKLVPVLVSAVPVRAAGGDLTGATMIIQDVSALKELEQLREEWAAIIAHDLQQPINAIVLRCDLLLRGELTEKQRADLRQVINATRRMGRMVNDLTDASLLETRRMRLNVQRLEVGQLVREVVDRLPDLASRTRITTPTQGALNVRADAERLEQVLDNLLSNASKYGAAQTEIRVDVASVNGCAEISVTNQGKPIPEAELPTLFDRYVRAQAARASLTKGSGLGLYIAKGLVEAHGGRIWATSDAERTSFHLTLPLEAELGETSGVGPASRREG